MTCLKFEGNFDSNLQWSQYLTYFDLFDLFLDGLSF